MQLDLKFSVYTLGLAAGTFTAALYGMNLKNFIEESDLGFWGVSAFCAVSCVIVFGYGLNRLRKVQRLKMWGGDRTSPLGHPAGLTRAQSWKNLEKDMKERLRDRQMESIREADPQGMLSGERTVKGEGSEEIRINRDSAAQKMAKHMARMSSAARLREP
jgi:hypothetical protein